jgi:predicted phage replisome organizer
MSEHDSKRYFWLKLKEDFFDDDAISWLEEQPNGKEYALFYLKLCLKSLKHDGVLIRTVGNILVPYDAKKLSEITRTNEDTVIVALELLKNIGLIEIQENGALFLTQLQTLIGSETNAAKRMRSARAKAKKIGTANNVREMFKLCSPELEKEKELDKDKDIDKDNTKNNNIYMQFAKKFNEKCVSLPKVRTKGSATRIKTVKARFKDLDEDWNKVDMFLNKVAYSDFLSGKTGWNHCSFDWIIKESNFTKIMEGNYDNKSSTYSNNNGFDDGVEVRWT